MAGAFYAAVNAASYLAAVAPASKVARNHWLLAIPRLALDPQGFDLPDRAPSSRTLRGAAATVVSQGLVRTACALGRAFLQTRSARRSRTVLGAGTVRGRHGRNAPRDPRHQD
jgi:hypothetical protein